jgi:hypothetical protein
MHCRISCYIKKQRCFLSLFVSFPHAMFSNLQENKCVIKIKSYAVKSSIMWMTFDFAVHDHVYKGGYTRVLIHTLTNPRTTKLHSQCLLKYSLSAYCCSPSLREPCRKLKVCITLYQFVSKLEF